MMHIILNAANAKPISLSVVAQEDVAIKADQVQGVSDVNIVLRRTPKDSVDS